MNFNVQEYQGNLEGDPNSKIGIVVSRFNAFITDNLLGGALDCLRRHSIPEGHIDVARVPGAVEIPLVLQTMAETQSYDALIALGAVIRGSTPHFDYVCSEVTRGVGGLSLRYKLPVIFGVLTTNNIEEAVERAGTKAGNKGFDAALNALEMIDLLKKVSSRSHA